MKLNIKKWVSDSYFIGLFGILSSVVLLSSCGDKEKPQEAGELPKAELIVATPGQRAETLGLLSMVPADAAGLMVCYDLPYLISAVEQSATVAVCNGDDADNDADMEEVDVETTADAGELVKSDGDEENVVEVDEEEVSLAAQFPVKQIVLASGPGKVDVIDALAADYPKLSKLALANQKEMMAKCFGMPGNASGLSQQEIAKEMLKELSNMNLFKLIDFAPGEGMAPIFVVADLTPDATMTVKNYINQGMGIAVAMSNGVASPYSMKSGDLEFAGISIDGPMLSQLLKASSGNLPEGVDPKAVGMLADNVAKGKLYIVTAFKDNVLVFSICTNPEKQLVIPAKPEDSILGSKDFDFADQYLDKKPAFAAYFNPRFCESLLNLYVASYSEDCNNLVAVMDEIKNSGKVDKALCEKTSSELVNFYHTVIDLMKRWDTSKGCTLYSWYDKGLNMEMTSGETDVYDWDNPAIYTAVCDMPNAVLGYAFSVTKDYSDSAVSIVESLGKATWYGIETANSCPLCTSDKFRKTYENLKLLQPGIVKIWNESKGLDSAFGRECAIVVDLNAPFPNCSGKCNIPENIVKNGCLPRIAAVQSIKDRSKLAPAWDSILVAFNDSAAKLTDGKWKLGAPQSEEKDGYTSYWYDCPKLPGYDMPAVTLNDKVYVNGTSKSFNYEVAAMAKPAASISPAVRGPLGLYMKFNTEPLAKAAEKWETSLPDSTEMSQISDLLKGFSSDIKGISYSISKEREKVYYRIHIEAK